MQDFAHSLRGEAARSYGNVVETAWRAGARLEMLATRLESDETREVLTEVLGAGQAVSSGTWPDVQDEWSDDDWALLDKIVDTHARVRATSRARCSVTASAISPTAPRERRHDIGTRGTMSSPTRSKISSRLCPVIVRPWLRSPTTRARRVGRGPHEIGDRRRELHRPARIVDVGRDRAVDPTVHVHDRTDARDARGRSSSARSRRPTRDAASRSVGTLNTMTSRVGS